MLPNSTASAGTTAGTADYASLAQLKDMEYRLNSKIESKSSSGAKTGLLWLVTVIALAGAGFAGYTAFQNQQRLAFIDNDLQNSRTQVSEALIKIESSATAFEQAQRLNMQLQQSHNVLEANDKALIEKVNEVISTQQQHGNAVNALSAQVAQYQDRNPNDWKLAESYFLVNNASAKAVFEKDTKAAVWLLTTADELLVDIEDQEVVALRQAISKDIATLKNIAQVDTRGIGMNLERAYENVDALVLEGYSDPQTRAAAFNKDANNEVSANVQDWKENLQKSAADFASRFVEVRRRNAEAATEFLTPEQDLYLRENIKTRILLAKADLSHGDKEAMVKNLNDAIKMIETYFDPESTVTQSTLEILKGIASSEITIQTPDVLGSATAFSNFAREHLLGRGGL